MEINIELINFLKKYSKINNDFIEDFFSLYDMKDKYNFCIDLDNISKWMVIRKDTLKDTLLNSYKENIDYIIKFNKTKSVGKPLEKIYLTPKCFKLMAMQSKSKKAVQIREFYYELENILDQYKNYIIEGLNQRINTLENNQKPLVNQKKGIIYIIETIDGIGHYKIGKTTNLKKRLLSYNGDKKDDIIPLYVYETDDIDNVELCIKSYMKKYKYRKYKEVYKVDINLLKELINDCAEFNEKTNLKIKWKSNIKGGNLYLTIYKE